MITLFVFLAATDLTETFTHELRRVTWTIVIPLGIVGLIAGVAYKAFERWSIKKIRSFKNRKNQSTQQSENVALNAPHCPVCNREMVKRTAGKGENRGSQFWGCSAFPKCRGTRQIN